MSVLILMRHAKAAERLEGEDDFDRPLTERGWSDGARAGAALAAALSARGWGIDRALVSPARRTRETFEAIAEALGAPPVESPMALYHASPEMLERAAEAAFAEGFERVMIIGHNPGIGAYAHGLAAQAGALDRLPEGWPTAAAAVFTLEAERSPPRVSLIYLFNPKA